MNQAPQNQASDESTRRFLPGLAALWMFIAFLLFLFFVSLSATFFPKENLGVLLLSGLSASAFLIVSARLLGSYPMGDNLAAAVALRSTAWPLLPLGALIGAGLQLPAERIHQWVVQVFPPSAEQLAKQAKIFDVQNSVTAVGMVVTLCLIVPLAEETFFRGVIYGAMRRSAVSVSRAFWTVAVGFTLCHLSLQTIFSIAIVAIILGAMRSWSGSLYPPLLAHIAFNGVTVFSQLRGATEISLVDLTLSQELLGYLLLFLCLSLFWVMAQRSPRALRARLFDLRLGELVNLLGKSGFPR
ncbi:MAG: CPBP family intramembrane metalloprotease [Polyangiaceae bacterium]|nr:CPBP family intramembrane metalloprotease [Polyangiaceae bacterium]